MVKVKTTAEPAKELGNTAVTGMDITREAPTKWHGRAVKRQVKNLVVAAKVADNLGAVNTRRSS
ncbi:hypothetical protein [Bradyrhizobium paxllaeri]|uniref:hypothetical protein n=1 Tax=Bradyrhizobium paxllaeri TaxID=190148 RepID=UPI001146F36B|nr:hypothetical protein [Bradyrhizobium paxllaeri]